MRISEHLQQQKIMVSDGAWGTQLQAKGWRPGECPELWCLTQRSAVLDIARGYAAAGAELIKTNSFGGHRIKLQSFSLAERSAEINAAAAEISREAAGPQRWVLGSMGPTGKLLLMGDVSEEELIDGFAEQATALERGGADAALIESMAALDEACLAIRAVRQSTQLEIICTLTFTRTLQGYYRTIMGVAPDEMAKACLAAGADIIGANCGQGFQQMIEVAQAIRQAAPQAPILVHANAGLPQNRAGQDVFPDTPEMMAEFVPALIQAGVNIIGGCCGTTPAHIAAIAQAVQQHAALR